MEYVPIGRPATYTCIGLCLKRGDACNHVTVTSSECILQKGTAHLTSDSNAKVWFKLDEQGKHHDGYFICPMYILVYYRQSHTNSIKSMQNIKSVQLSLM